MEVCILAAIGFWCLLHAAMGAPGGCNMPWWLFLSVIVIDIGLFLGFSYICSDSANKDSSETPAVVKEETDSADSSPEPCSKDLNAMDDAATECNSTNANNYERIIDLFDQLTPDDQTKLLETLQKRIQGAAETSP